MFDIHGAPSKSKVKNSLKIVIVGCGKVGATLTEQLYLEGHDITLIDMNPDRLAALTDIYDVMGIAGNGASYKVQQEAGIETADLIIAVTDMDELNLLCCTVAKRAGHCQAIARVRTPEYSDEVGYLKEKLELAMIINPEREAAQEIARVLSIPMALSVNPFAGGRVEMVRFKVPDDNILVGESLAQIGSLVSRQVLLCVVERDGQVYIPDGRFVIRRGDMVSFIASMKSARMFFDRIGIRTHVVRTAMLIGGGKAAYYLAKRLLDNGIAVKIIEKSKERCEMLSEILPDAIIINGDGTDAELLREEGLGSVDAFIPLTGLDEENILLTLHAADVSNAKAITKVKRNTFHNVINKLELGSVVYPKYITAEAIIAYVRGWSVARDNSNIETLYHMFDSRVEAIEFNVGENSHVTDIRLKDLKKKDDLLIACISRNGSTIIPGGLDGIKAGDSVVIVTTHTGFQTIDDILL